MVLRIEDTDRARSTDAAVAVILDALQWLGLDWQRGPFYQTERGARYAQVIAQLLDGGFAYHCFCTPTRLDALREQQRARGQKPRYDGHCRAQPRRAAAGESAVVRFCTPRDSNVVFDDIVRGRVAVDNDQLDDLIIARADGSPTYNLCAVVDDIDMGITHVIRGDDHLNNTPRQIHIFNALQAALPTFAHIPLILGEDGQRLSKRHGAVSVLDYREMGVLPQALLNYLARLGWASGDREIFSRDELIAAFDIADVNKSAASFDLAKLLWVNEQHLRECAAAELTSLLDEQLRKLSLSPDNGPPLVDVVELFRTRVQTIGAMAAQAAFCFADEVEYDDAAVRKHLNAATRATLQTAHDELRAVTEWNQNEIHHAVARVCKTHALKLGQVAPPLRVAVAGRAHTPAIDATLQLVGQDRCCARIQTAVAKLDAAS